MNDNKNEANLFERLRAQERKRQRELLEAEQRRRNLAGVFDGTIALAELYRRFGLTSSDNSEEGNNQ